MPTTADDREKFGTYTRDNPGQDYADQRYYGVGTGRFLSVDTGGGNPSSATTLNKYSYVAGDPVNNVDPRGRDLMLIGGGGKLDCTLFWNGYYDDDETLEYNIDWTVCYNESPGTGASVASGEGGDPNPDPPPYRPPGYDGALQDLAKPNCFGAFGFKTAEAAQAAFASLTFVPEALGVLKIQDVPGGQSIVQGTPAPAQSNNNTVTINTSYNWVDFSQNPAFDTTTGKNTTFNYLGILNQALGATMSSSQISAMILLHEFDHTPAGANAPQETDFVKFNQKFVTNCIK